MVKILHMADLHLDSPFAGDYYNAEVMRQHLREAFLYAVKEGYSRNVRLVLIAGDLFDNECVSAHTLRFLNDVFNKYSDMYFFISAGNHDFYYEGGAYAQNTFPDNVHIFKTHDIEKVVLEEQGCNIYGFGAVNSSYGGHILDGFCAEDDGKINIMLYHGNLISQNTSDEYYPLTQKEISGSGMDYIALGHVHKTGGVLKAGDTSYAYSGCISPRGFDEPGEKGVYIGEVDKKSVRLDFVKTALIEYNILTVDITDIGSISDIKEKINAALLPPDKNCIVRVVLTGESFADLPLGGALFEDCFEGLLYGEIKNKTDVKIDYSDYSEATLTGSFVIKMKQKIDEVQDENQKQILQQALKAGLYALGGKRIEN